MELKYYTILTSPNYNNPSLLVKDWNKENYPFGFGGVNHDGTECIWAQGQEVYIKKDVDEEIAELKQKLQDQCISCPVKMQEDDVVAELKQKLENVQASMYADVVDANMDNRRLRRALWIARAEWARSSALSYHLIESHPDKDVSATYKRKANKWEKAKDKCLKKAEEYK